MVFVNDKGDCYSCLFSFFQGMIYEIKMKERRKKKKTMNMELGFTALSRITRGKGRCVPMTYETELTLTH